MTEVTQDEFGDARRLDRVLGIFLPLPIKTENIGTRFERKLQGVKLFPQLAQLE